MPRKRPIKMEILENVLGADGLDELNASRPDIAAASSEAEELLANMAELTEPAEPPKKLFKAVEAELDGPHGRSARTMRADEGEWRKRTPKIWQKMLHEDPDSGRSIYLLRCLPGAIIPPHHHKHNEHVFMIEGELTVNKETLRKGDSQFSPAGTWHAMIRSPKGCLVMIHCS